jgi:hypothetical protein
MISVKVTDTVISRISANFKELDSVGKDKLLRTIIAGVAPKIRYRVHTEGKDENGDSFGTYSNAYLKRRQKKKHSGNKIIMFDTGQMQNDIVLSEIKPIKTQSGYAIGTNNTFNAAKYAWLSDRFGFFYKMTVGEVAHMKVIINEFIKNYFTKK